MARVGPGLLRRLLVVVSAAVPLVCAACAGNVPVADAPTVAVPSDRLVSSALVVPANLAQAPFDRQRQVLIPAGWTMSLWARLPGARLAVWAPDGSLLVSRPAAGQVVRFVPGGLAGPGGPAGPTMSVLLTGLNQPHGLSFSGDALYVAQSNEVEVYRYTDGVATAPRPLATGLPDARSPELRGAYAHALKSVAVAGDGSVYFSIGSTGNISVGDRNAVPQRATIMRIPPGGGPAEVFARGVRNGTGLAIGPDGSVWTAVNGRDDVRYPYDRPFADDSESSLGKLLPAYVADHPAEELARLSPGRDLGWPYCNPEIDVQPGTWGTAYRYSRAPFVRDIETNAAGDKLDCAALAPVEQTLGAHSAPLGLSFTELPPPYGAGALVGVHGSWDRVPPRAPEVSFFAWRDGTLGVQQTLVGGFQAPDGSRWGRPVAAVRGPDGAIYITDDAAGAIYRLAPPGR